MSADRQFGVTYGQPHMPGRLRSYATYNAGCRCDDCREAWRIERRNQQAQRRASWTGEHPDGKPISTNTYTNWGCRCDGCRTAWADEMRRNGASKRWQERQRAKRDKP